MYNILFVCLGNICRSTMAEAVMRHKAKGLDIFVDSCGTAGYHIGDIPHLGTRKELDYHNISYDGIKGRKISKSDFEKFDLIVAMDDSNVEDLRYIKDSPKICKLTDFIKNSEYDNVPDPYYYNNFSLVYQIIDEATDEILQRVTQN